jgi:hypothetical protein
MSDALKGPYLKTQMYMSDALKGPYLKTQNSERIALNGNTHSTIFTKLFKFIHDRNNKLNDQVPSFIMNCRSEFECGLSLSINLSLVYKSIFVLFVLPR